MRQSECPWCGGVVFNGHHCENGHLMYRDQRPIGEIVNPHVQPHVPDPRLAFDRRLIEEGYKISREIANEVNATAEKFRTTQRYARGWTDPRALLPTRITWRYKLRLWIRDKIWKLRAMVRR